MQYERKYWALGNLELRIVVKMIQTEDAKEVWTQLETIIKLNGESGNFVSSPNTIVPIRSGI